MVIDLLFNLYGLILYFRFAILIIKINNNSPFLNSSPLSPFFLLPCETIFLFSLCNCSKYYEPHSLTPLISLSNLCRISHPPLFQPPLDFFLNFSLSKMNTPTKPSLASFLIGSLACIVMGTVWLTPCCMIGFLTGFYLIRYLVLVFFKV